MASLSYTDIYSRYYSKAMAYDFLDLTPEQVNDFLCEWLHSSISKPYIRRLFTEITMDDEILTIVYTMKYSIDDEADNEFVKEILSIGLTIEWLEPKINSITNILQVFGTKEENFFSQSNHLSELQSLRDSLIKRQRRMIADRGYAWNTYLDGES